MAATATSDSSNPGVTSVINSEIPPNGPSSANISSEISEEEEKQAEALKTEANEYFKQEKFQQAVDLYTKAIEINPHSLISLFVL